jgi:hypothetical protein
LLYTGGGGTLSHDQAPSICWLLPSFDEAVVADQSNQGRIFEKADALLSDKWLTAGDSFHCELPTLAARQNTGYTADGSAIRTS